jgi:hypothetical protein
MSNEGRGWVKCHNQDINSIIVRFSKTNYEQTFNINYPLCY